MEEQGDGTNYLVQVMLAQAIEEISPNPCARRRDGVRSGTCEVFLGPLLHQSRAKGAGEAGEQTEGPKYIHGDIQATGASRLGIHNGRECCISRMGELKGYLPEQQFRRIRSEPADLLD